jgi:5-methylcytosine-specific restriction endonuclease McrA
MVCSICKQTGHNTRSCKQKVSLVSAPKIEAKHDVNISSTLTSSKKSSRNEENLDAYRKLGRELPNCINDGCSRFVAVRHWNDDNLPSLKSECAMCATARKNGKILEGISFVKKHYCENKDGCLGFTCPCDKTRYAEFPSDCYHIDHINGNHSDNRRENIMTLCMMCHTIKGKREGDFNGSKPTSLRFSPRGASLK